MGADPRRIEGAPPALCRAPALRLDRRRPHVEAPFPAAGLPRRGFCGVKGNVVPDARRDPGSLDAYAHNDPGSPRRSCRDDDRERIMATDIRVPTLGESVTEATIGRWFKKPGEPVKADEPLVELETDKVTLEVNAPAAGVLGDIVAKDGATVAPGAVLGSIVEGDGSGAKPAAPPKASAPAAAPPAKPAAPAQAAQPAKAAAAKDSGPAVARLAKESGVDPS